MGDLLKFAIEAHGGLDRWRKMKTVSAHLLNGGVLWGLKGKDGIVNDIHVTVELRKQQASHWPFLKPNLHTSFRRDRIAIETSEGQVEQERFNPRESFKGHLLETPWDDLHLAYFAGYAMWTYLNTPFLFAIPGIQTEEIQPWQENGQVWRRLRVTFPPSIASHSAIQTFYFDRNGLLKRHDYDVDVLGGTPAAHYASELREFSGIMVPTKRRVLARQPDGNPVPGGPLIVSIDLSEIAFIPGEE